MSPMRITLRVAAGGGSAIVVSRRCKPARLPTDPRERTIIDFDLLTDEQKAKVKACTSPEEMLALAKEEGYELSDEELEGISGGGWGCTVCSAYQYGDERDDIDESLVNEAFISGEVRGDELD